MRTKTIKAEKLHARHMKDDPAYRKAYEALEGEFALVGALIRARARAHLSQAEVASRMGTTESAVSRLESGRVKPSTRTLERYAEATGHRLRISLEPASRGRLARSS
jgi:ribosome-binding protein aMBF1 (putative translation factor)